MSDTIKTEQTKEFINETLLVDIGTTNINWQVLGARSSYQVVAVADFYPKKLPRHEQAIVSCVANKHLIKKFNSVNLIKAKPYKDLIFEYDLKQLGADRYCSIIAGYELFTGKDIVIIDIGTAITIDKIANNQHTSLGISPGLKKIRQTFHFGGEDSKKSWQLGTQNMVKSYLEKVINDNLDSQILITGGGQDIVEIEHKNIKKYQNLVLSGLEILSKNE